MYVYSMALWTPLDPLAQDSSVMIYLLCIHQIATATQHDANPWWPYARLPGMEHIDLVSVDSRIRNFHQMIQWQIWWDAKNWEIRACKRNRPCEAGSKVEQNHINVLFDLAIYIYSTALQANLDPQTVHSFCFTQSSQQYIIAYDHNVILWEK